MFCDQQPEDPDCAGAVSVQHLRIHSVRPFNPCAMNAACLWRLKPMTLIEHFVENNEHGSSAEIISQSDSKHQLTQHALTLTSQSTLQRLVEDTLIARQQDRQFLEHSFRRLLSVLEEARQSTPRNLFESTHIEGGNVHLGDQYHYHIATDSNWQQALTSLPNAPQLSLSSTLDRSEAVAMLSSRCSIDHHALLTTSTTVSNRIRHANRTRNLPLWLHRVRQHWQNPPESSLLVMKGSFTDRFALKSLCVDLVHHLNHLRIVILHVFSRPGQSFSIRDAFKSLLLQAFTVLPDHSDQSIWMYRTQRFNQASSITDYVNLLADWLASMKLVFLVVKLEAIENNDKAECRQALRDLISILRTRNPDTVVRILLTSHTDLPELPLPDTNTNINEIGVCDTAPRWIRRPARARNLKRHFVEQPDIFSDLGRTRKRGRAA